MSYLCRRYKVSERRACRLVGQHRSTQRYEPMPDDFEVRLVKAMRQLAEIHPRWGYRQIHRLLVEDGWKVNRKRIERLWRAEGLKVPPSKAKNSGKKAGGGAENSIWNLPAAHPDHIWSFDFMTDRTVDGAAYRILNVVDEYTRRCVCSYQARNIGARRVQQVLERVFAAHGKPRFIRSDNGREFIADTMAAWLGQQGVTSAFVEKGSPQQNAFIERFNGSMRRERVSTPRSSTRSSKPESSSPAGSTSTTPSGPIAAWAAAPLPRSRSKPQSSHRSAGPDKMRSAGKWVVDERHYQHKNWTSRFPSPRLSKEKPWTKALSQDLDLLQGDGQADLASG